MLNALLLPFRLVGWVCVQLFRLCALLIIQPLRVLLAPLGVLSSRLVLIVVVVVYGLFALRVSTPQPVYEWYTTIVHYPYPAEVTGLQLLIDTIAYRETDHPRLRTSQWWIAMSMLLLVALCRIARRKHQKLRNGLAKSAGQLVVMQPPPLWTVESIPAAVSPVMPPPAPAASQMPETHAPSMPPVTVYARYGLHARTLDDGHAAIIERLSPELQAFITPKP